MRLKSLLLGSSAAVFVGGASISGAQAADPNPAGLVVATMANYVESCNNGNGWKKGNWCVTVSGDMTFTARFGYDISIAYGATPTADDDANVDVPTDVSRDIFQNSSGGALFATSTNLAISVTRDDVSLRFPVIGSSAQFVVGDLTLTSSGLTWRPTFGGFSVGLLLRETNTLGWVDRLKDDAGNTEWAGVATVPDVGIELGFGPVDFEAHYGRRVDTGTGTYTETNNAGSPFNTFGFSAGIELPLGPLTITTNAAWDRIPVITAYGVVAGDDNDTVTFDNGNAWIVQGMVEGGFGPVNIAVEAALATNWGGYNQLIPSTSTPIYPYSLNLVGRYLFVGGQVGLEFGADGEFTVGATYSRGPQVGDAVLTVDAGVEVGLGMVDGLTVRAGVGLDRQLNGAPEINVLDITTGFTYVPGGNLPGVTITGLVGHERDLTGEVPPATRGQMTVRVAF